MIPLRGIFLSARHAARSCMRGKRLFALLVLVSLPLLALGAKRIFDSPTMKPGTFHNVILMLVYHFTVPFSALLLGVGILGDELEGRTITYLWTRPVGRAWTYLGRYLGSAFGFAALFVPVMAIALHILTPGEGLEGVSLWRPIWVGLGGFMVYLAFFSLLRAIFKRALVAGMFYAMIVDLAVAHIPGVGAAKLSIWHYMAVLHTSAAEPNTARILTELSKTIGPTETAASAAWTLLGMGVVALAAGMTLVRTREYPVAGSVA